MSVEEFIITYGYWFVPPVVAAIGGWIYLKRRKRRNAAQPAFIAPLEEGGRVAELEAKIADLTAKANAAPGVEDDFDRAVARAFIRSVENKSTFAVRGTIGIKRKIKIGKEEAELDLQGTMQPTLEEAAAKADDAIGENDEVAG